MENITGSDVGIVGILAIIAKQYWPAIKSLAIALFGKVAPSIAADRGVNDLGCVAAFNTLRKRLTPETAKQVWSEIEPKEAK